MIVLLVLAALVVGTAILGRRVSKVARDKLKIPEDRMTATLMFFFQAIVSCAVGLLLTAWLFSGWLAPIAGLLIGIVCIVAAERAAISTLIPRLEARALDFKTQQETSTLPPRVGGNRALAKRQNKGKRQKRKKK